MKSLLTAIIVGLMANATWAGETCCGKTEAEAASCPVKAQTPCCAEQTAEVKAQTSCGAQKTVAVKTKTSCAATQVAAKKSCPACGEKTAKRMARSGMKGATLLARL